MSGATTTITDKLALREATYGDSDFVFRVIKESLGTYVAQTWGWDQDDQLSLHQRRFNPDATWIVVYEGTDVGLLAVDDHTDHVYLREILLLPDAQGLGIGTLLISRLLEDARHRGLPVILRVMKVNTRAQDLYKKLGFSVTGEIETHFYMEHCWDSE